MNKSCMKKKTASLLLASLFLVISSCSSSAKDKIYYVTRIIDGDTIEIQDGRLVRYIGMDTPELREKRNGRWVYRPQPFGEEAKSLNGKLVMNKDIRLDFDVVTEDKYGRLLAYVYVGKTFVNEEMVREGLAQLLTIPPDVKHVEDLKRALREAKKEKRGMWKIRK